MKEWRKKVPKTILIVIAITVTVQAGTTRREIEDHATLPVDNLGDAITGPWKVCSSTETCTLKKEAVCAAETLPHLKCGTSVWKEELSGCHTCAGGWLLMEDGQCTGTSCEDTVRRSVYSCANTGLNPNCKLIKTRYCDQSKICHGSWSAWTSDSMECSQQCGEHRFRVIKRTCMQNGRASGSCKVKEGTLNPAMIETIHDNCANVSCSTTALPTTASKKATLTAWSEWSRCTATCETPNGREYKYRECVYEDGKDAPMTSCEKEGPSQEERSCVYNGVVPCEKTIKETTMKLTTTRANLLLPTTTEVKKKTDREITVNSKTTKEQGARRVVKEPDRETAKKRITGEIFPTKAYKTGSNEQTTATAQDLQKVKGETGKWQYQVLVTVLATTACLIILVVILFLCCRKKTKKSKNNGKREISIVGLQAHSGFTDGGEFERLRKSTVTNDELVAAIYTDRSRDNLANFNLPSEMGNLSASTRNLPQIPVENDSNDVKEHKNHIYEDMNLLSSSSMATGSQRYERKRANTIVTPNTTTQRITAKKRSSSLQKNQLLYVTPQKTAPPKPPRKSLIMAIDAENNQDYETREIPKSLYESSENVYRKVVSPDLRLFLDSIEPPAYSPPVTPLDDQATSAKAQFLGLPDSHLVKSKQASRSAPVSPSHSMLQMNEIGSVISPVPYMVGDHNGNAHFKSNPLVVPPSGTQWMVPAGTSNAGVIYVPWSPIYSPGIAAPILAQAPVTPLHASADVHLRHTKSCRPRPRTMGYLPEISISEADIDYKHLAPPRRATSPLLDGYAEMRYIPSVNGNNSTEREVENSPVRNRTFHQLHGTHNVTPTKNVDHNEQSVGASQHANISQPEEDGNGYLIPYRSKMIQTDDFSPSMI